MNVEDILGRPQVPTDWDRLREFARGRSVLVTGGGGSIGSELCRLLAGQVARLMILDNSEAALHAIMDDADRRGSRLVEGYVADIRDRARTHDIMHRFAPDVTFHAAALKHVPILERDWQEAVKTNVFGTVSVADAVYRAGGHMVMISTDKAVHPTSMLGATKRMAERYCWAMDGHNMGQRFVSVRFGNVLGSSGSVVPKFLEQIEAGGPVTVTHPGMMRYLMTISEACGLVIAAAVDATRDGCPASSTYLLAMGEQVSIHGLAKRMVAASGKDVPIAITGVRPGERFTECLVGADEDVADTAVPGLRVVTSRKSYHYVGVMDGELHALGDAVAAGDHATACRVLDFKPNLYLKA